MDEIRNEVQEQSLEALFSDLEQIMKKMESTEVSLEESFSLYHEGMLKLKACNEKLDMAEKKMILLQKES